MWVIVAPKDDIRTDILHQGLIFTAQNKVFFGLFLF